MITQMEPTLAAQYLEKMGLAIDGGFRWLPAFKDTARNIMVTSDRIVEEYEDPYVRVNRALDSQQRGEQADSDALSLHMAYCADGRYWARRGPADAVKLLNFLSQVLQTSSGAGVLLQSNQGEGHLLPEVWFSSDEATQLSGIPGLADLFCRLHLRAGDRAPLSSAFPDDIEDVVLLGKWCLASGWRNTYIMCESGLKIVLCHEQDLHFCSLDPGQISRIGEAARMARLFVAPFDIQQCV